MNDYKNMDHTTKTWTTREIDDMLLPFCACGQPYSRCDGSRLACYRPQTGVLARHAAANAWLASLDTQLLGVDPDVI